MKIAYFQTAFLGDLLLAVPALMAVRKEHPEAEITLFCRGGLGSLMESLPCVDKAIEVDKKSKASRLTFSKALEGLSFDILYSPHQSLRTHLWVRKISAVKKIGFYRWWNFPFFNERVSRPLFIQDALRQMSLLMSTIPSVQSNLQELLDSGKPSLGVPQFASMTMSQDFWKSTSQESLPKASGRYVCISPGSVWATKRWTFEGFLEVARSFLSQGYEVYFLGAPDEARLCESLAKQAGGTSLAGVLNLFEVAQFLSGAALMISNDSGGQHLASLAGVPTVSIFGPTVLSLGYEPWQEKAHVVEVDLKCRPCGKHGHQTCPIGTHDCMKRVSAKMVLEATRLFL